jgi:hypothetical protein
MRRKSPLSFKLPEDRDGLVQEAGGTVLKWSCLGERHRKVHRSLRARWLEMEQPPRNGEVGL